MKKIFLIVPVFLCKILAAQNVGIGTLTPSSKLNVNGQVTIDQKNFGGYGGLLIKGGTSSANYPNIAFSVLNNAIPQTDVITGYIGGNINNDVAGSESMDLVFLTSQAGFSGLSEKFRIKDNGNIGIGLNPSYKLHLGNATNGLRIEGPATPGGTALSIAGYGNVVVDKPGIVGGRLTILENGNTGIGQNNPGFPLNFASTLGDKISLYGNTGNHYGFGVQGGTLQIHAGVATDDIAFGTGSSTAFAERFRFKGNGSMAVNGNIGAAGQVLTSSGSGSAASWSNNSNTQQYNNAIEKTITQSYTSTGAEVEIVDFAHSLVLSKPSLVICNFNVFALATYCVLCGATSASIDVKINGNSYIYSSMDINNSTIATINGYRVIKLPAGTYNVNVFVTKVGGGGNISLVPPLPTDGFGYLNIQVIPQ